ncbi:MAG: 4-hydroxy-3-methylbut-2-enyl diphosphate reductase [Actinobacteria bacterium]|jgi:4-hydroxy-3-methylbut-2-enyl diphosphate reductase|nr:4-hydroxy-3-methylbut-2-enyl diphosphate reductase [Actinomycetota bacterium]MCL6095186.1 4-hydroxy-3-methylbut-2-enyl diphosphate reductase [Actinomycetota bacterium]
MAVNKVLLAKPRGFCAGVEMAIKALSFMVRIFEPPIYCYHEIVHNSYIVDRFRSLGVVFVDDISDVPSGAPVMLSAHGSAPQVVDEARARAGIVVNAVCPLVTKVHHEMKTKAAQGYTIIYIGHAGHEEAEATMAEAPDKVVLVEDERGIDQLKKTDGKVALLTQTTLSRDDWEGVIEKAKRKFPDLWVPIRRDLCYATTNRQAAVQAIAGRSDTVVVIGSANSSNAIALEKVARSSGCSNVVRIDSANELPDNLSGTVGVTAGASAPEHIVEEVVKALKPRYGVEEVSVIEEDEYFPPPPELRELLKATANEIALATAHPLKDGYSTNNGKNGAYLDDRAISAMTALLDADKADVLSSGRQAKRRVP